ncbi:MAG: hypothetical protein ABH830_02050 [Patescibacteria group bacterium]
MQYINLWTILIAITVFLLIKYRGTKNAVWGGFTIGIIIGLLVAIFYLIKGSGFGWIVIGKGAMIGTIAGFIAELLGKVSDRHKKRSFKK